MSTNRLIFILAVLSALLVTAAVSIPASKAAIPTVAGANDFYQRHSSWGVANVAGVAIAPITGQIAASDYFQRHPELNLRAGASSELSDYFLRHPVSFQQIDKNDRSDYFLRH